jgi:Holliday junction resolvase
MRRKGDYRKDGIIKRELLGEMRADGFNVVRAWDDNPAVVAVWESEGIEVTVVPGWTEI